MSESSSEKDEGFGRSESENSAGQDRVFPAFEPLKQHKIGSIWLIEAR